MYDVWPDGSRFLIVVPTPRAVAHDVHVVWNLFEKLKAKVGNE